MADYIPSQKTMAHLNAIADGHQIQALVDDLIRYLPARGRMFLNSKGMVVLETSKYIVEVRERGHLS